MIPGQVSPAKVAAERSYYDYPEGANPGGTAGQAFAELETNFPKVRRNLIASDFQGWAEHCDYLVRYSQMLRARSRLFRAEFTQYANLATFHRVAEVHHNPPGPDAGKTGTTLRYSDFNPQGVERDVLLRNLSITQMREEMRKGAGEFAGWQWCLLFTRDITYPVITADNAVILVGFGSPSREEAALRADTLFVFPVCWQACLVGRPLPFERETEELAPSSLSDLYNCYLNDTDSRFAYSPNKLSRR